MKPLGSFWYDAAACWVRFICNQDQIVAEFAKPDPSGYQDIGYWSQYLDQDIPDYGWVLYDPKSSSYAHYQIRQYIKPRVPHPLDPSQPSPRLWKRTELDNGTIQHFEKWGETQQRFISHSTDEKGVMGQSALGEFFDKVPQDFPQNNHYRLPIVGSSPRSDQYHLKPNFKQVLEIPLLKHDDLFACWDLERKCWFKLILTDTASLTREMAIPDSRDPNKVSTVSKVSRWGTAEELKHGESIHLYNGFKQSYQRLVWSAESKILYKRLYQQLGLNRIELTQRFDATTAQWRQCQQLLPGIKFPPAISVDATTLALMQPDKAKLEMWSAPKLKVRVSDDEVKSRHHKKLIPNLKALTRHVVNDLISRSASQQQCILILRYILRGQPSAPALADMCDSSLALARAFYQNALSAPGIYYLVTKPSATVAEYESSLRKRLIEKLSRYSGKRSGQKYKGLISKQLDGDVHLDEKLNAMVEQLQYFANFENDAECRQNLQGRPPMEKSEIDALMQAIAYLDQDSDRLTWQGRRLYQLLFKECGGQGDSDQWRFYNIAKLKRNLLVARSQYLSLTVKSFEPLARREIDVAESKQQLSTLYQDIDGDEKLAADVSPQRHGFIRELKHLLSKYNDFIDADPVEEGGRDAMPAGFAHFLGRASLADTVEFEGYYKPLKKALEQLYLHLQRRPSKQRQAIAIPLLELFQPGAFQTCNTGVNIFIDKQLEMLTVSLSMQERWGLVKNKIIDQFANIHICERGQSLSPGMSVHVNGQLYKFAISQQWGIFLASELSSLRDKHLEAPAYYCQIYTNNPAKILAEFETYVVEQLRTKGVYYLARQLLDELEPLLDLEDDYKNANFPAGNALESGVIYYQCMDTGDGDFRLICTVKRRSEPQPQMVILTAAEFEWLGIKGSQAFDIATVSLGSLEKLRKMLLINYNGFIDPPGERYKKITQLFKEMLDQHIFGIEDVINTDDSSLRADFREKLPRYTLDYLLQQGIVAEPSAKAIRRQAGVLGEAKLDCQDNPRELSPDTRLDDLYGDVSIITKWAAMEHKPKAFQQLLSMPCLLADVASREEQLESALDAALRHKQIDNFSALLVWGFKRKIKLSRMRKQRLLCSSWESEEKEESNAYKIGAHAIDVYTLFQGNKFLIPLPALQRLHSKYLLERNFFSGKLLLLISPKILASFLVVIDRDSKSITEHQRTLLMTVIDENNCELMRELLDNYYTVDEVLFLLNDQFVDFSDHDCPDLGPNTLLQYAMVANKVKFVELLLKKEFDINRDRFITNFQSRIDAAVAIGKFSFLLEVLITSPILAKLLLSEPSLLDQCMTPAVGIFEDHPPTEKQRGFKRFRDLKRESKFMRLADLGRVVNIFSNCLELTELCKAKPALFKRSLVYMANELQYSFSDDGDDVWPHLLKASPLINRFLTPSTSNQHGFQQLNPNPNGLRPLSVEQFMHCYRAGFRNFSGVTILMKGFYAASVVWEAEFGAKSIIPDINFYGATLAGEFPDRFNPGNSSCEEGQFEEANLTSSSFEFSSLANANCNGAILTNATLPKAEGALKGLELTGATLDGVDMTDIRLHEVKSLYGLNLSKVKNLHRAHGLELMSMRGVTISRQQVVDLYAAGMRNFKKVKIRGDLLELDLYGANFYKARTSESKYPKFTPAVSANRSGCIRPFFPGWYIMKSDVANGREPITFDTAHRFSYEEFLEVLRKGCKNFMGADLTDIDLSRFFRKYPSAKSININLCGAKLNLSRCPDYSLGWLNHVTLLESKASGQKEGDLLIVNNLKSYVTRYDNNIRVNHNGLTGNRRAKKILEEVIELQHCNGPVLTDFLNTGRVEGIDPRCFNLFRSPSSKTAPGALRWKLRTGIGCLLKPLIRDDSRKEVDEQKQFQHADAENKDRIRGEVRWALVSYIKDYNSSVVAYHNGSTGIRRAQKILDEVIKLRRCDGPVLTAFLNTGRVEGVDPRRFFSLFRSPSSDTTTGALRQKLKSLITNLREDSHKGVDEQKQPQQLAL